MALDAEVFMPDKKGREYGQAIAVLLQVKRGADVVPFEEEIGQDGGFFGFCHVKPPAAEVGIVFGI